MGGLVKGKKGGKTDGCMMHRSVYICPKFSVCQFRKFKKNITRKEEKTQQRPLTFIIKWRKFKMRIMNRKSGEKKAY